MTDPATPEEQARHLTDALQAAMAAAGLLPLDGLGMVRFMVPETGDIGHAFLAFGGTRTYDVPDALDPIIALGLHSALGVWVDTFTGQYADDDDG